MEIRKITGINYVPFWRKEETAFNEKEKTRAYTTDGSLAQGESSFVSKFTNSKRGLTDFNQT